MRKYLLLCLLSAPLLLAQAGAAAPTFPSPSPSTAPVVSLSQWTWYQTNPSAENLLLWGDQIIAKAGSDLFRVNTANPENEAVLLPVPPHDEISDAAQLDGLLVIALKKENKYFLYSKNRLDAAWKAFPAPNSDFSKSLWVGLASSPHQLLAASNTGFSVFEKGAWKTLHAGLRPVRGKGDRRDGEFILTSTHLYVATAHGEFGGWLDSLELKTGTKHLDLLQGLPVTGIAAAPDGRLIACEGLGHMNCFGTRLSRIDEKDQVIPIYNREFCKEDPTPGPLRESIVLSPALTPSGEVDVLTNRSVLRLEGKTLTPVVNFEAPLAGASHFLITAQGDLIFDPWEAGLIILSPAGNQYKVHHVDFPGHLKGGK